MKNSDLYKKTFSKLHALNAGQMQPEGRRQHRQLRKPILACIAATAIMMFAATAAYAMTGEGPIRFFRSFFDNGDEPVTEEINNTYVLVSDQKITYKNMEIVLEGYSYTERILLAKFGVSSLDGSAIDSDGLLRQIIFGVLSAESSETKLKDREDGSVEVSVRMNLGESGEQSSSAKLLVWDREKGGYSSETIGEFMIGEPSAISEIVLDDIKIPECLEAKISGMGFTLYMDNSISEREDCPAEEILLKMKDGRVLRLYDKVNGTDENDIVSGISFSWSDGEGSRMTIEFSSALDSSGMEAVVINGEEYKLHD
ncbi:hypothetical protein [Clostridium transplantifaecale]|uniref:hypothetical protein n=1 Tax=Clostridium transplantifaecale TaxID=2479838 RepID=UPI000F63B0ED|nr:hypothetical protein [Clostridium transplantifaecale]